MNETYTSLYRALRRRIDRHQLVTDPLRRYAYGTDAGFYRLTPRLVVRPRTEEEVGTVLRLMQRYRTPVTFRAAGTALSGQAITDSVLLLATEGWDGVRILDEGRLVEAGPGVVGARLNRLLAPYGRKLGPDPASIRSAMVGGIVANNASGMNGTEENSYKTIDSVRILLADGTTLDTGDPASRDAFRQSHAAFLEELTALRERVCRNEALRERIRHKYRLKNTTGLGINALVDFEDPFEIITHLMVGSEGTLAFLAAVRLRTLEAMPCRASAMLYFADMATACRTVQCLKGSAVGSVELLDRLALRAIEDMEGIPPFIRELPDGGTALLLETTAPDGERLTAQIASITALLDETELLQPVRFTDRAEEYSAYWKIRSGVFPSVGAMRRPGTSCLIEDVVFPMDRLPEATIDLQRLIAAYGYRDGVIYGHSIEGNYHFIINEDFSDPARIEHFDRFLHATAELVVGKYNGSLKGEHGTGRNIAPYVAYEWGDELYDVMRRIKALFDPENLLNRGVIFNDDAQCNLHDLKRMTLTNTHVDRCIECGFCEVNCLTCGLTLSARQRIAAQREIARLRRTGEDPALLRALEKGYRYYGEQTCAKDGLCALSCPVSINTGELTRDLRAEAATPTSIRTAQWCADRFRTVTRSVRVGLKAVNALRTVMGSRLFGAVARGLRRLTGGLLPLWTRAMPRGIAMPRPRPQSDRQRKVVYFPSCINQVMGAAKTDPTDEPLYRVMERVLARAGWQVVYPENMGHLCCGTIWESKGFAAQADQKTAELDEALWKASEGGRYPVLCDQSPCLYRMKEKITRMRLYEPAEFLVEHCMERLRFTPVDDPVAVHLTCSMTKMGKSEAMLRVARACSTRVLVPDEVGCCGFAGDRGFTHPEVNAYALRKLRPQIERAGIREGYSNSRTCEIGLTTNSGVPYRSIVYLVDRCTAPVEP